MRHKERHLLLGFMLLLGIVLSSAVFITMAYEYRETREDMINLARQEAQTVLDTVVLAIKATAGIRMYLQDAGVSNEIIRDIVYKFGTSTILRDLWFEKSFEYLVCQCQDEYEISLGFGVNELSSIDTDPFLQNALSNQVFDTRMIPGTRYNMEAVRPFITDKKPYLLRVCMRLDSVQRLERQMRSRLLLLGSVFLFVTLLLVMYIFNIHNIRLLARERDSISEEVVQIQQRMRQQERVLAMGRLAAGVAHEIRNPLNAIQILAQRLQREIKTDEESKEKLQTFTGVMKDELKRLNGIVEEFLEFARTKPPSFEEYDPVKLVKDVSFLESGVARARHVTLKEIVQTDCKQILLDPQQIKQALVNVLQNALDVTPEEGEICIRVIQKDGWTEISVEDSGPGMTEEESEQAFDLYYSTKPHGTGLGLAITQRIVEQHGGEIDITSKKPHGTRIAIRIPNRKADENTTDR